MNVIYKITAGGIIALAAAACIAARCNAAGEKNDPVVIESTVTKIDSFSASEIKDATIEDEGAAYSGEAWLKSDGTVIHPRWFEGDKLILADGIYYLIKAEAAPDYYYNGSSNFKGNIDIGNTSSEEANSFEMIRGSEARSRVVDGTAYTYRTLSKNGAMAVNLKCSPTEINYLTVRLWGGDTGDTILWVSDPVSGNMNDDNSHQPHRNDGIDRRDWVELNTSSSTPQYDGGFIYTTYEIPMCYTKDRESVSLRIYSTGGSASYNNVVIKDQTEESRGIYDVYMTQNAAFDPAEFGTVDGGYSGNVANLYSVSDGDAMAEQKAALKAAVLSGIEQLRNWQIFGDEAPSYMQGMITRTDWRKSMPQSEAEWKSKYYNGSFMLKQNLTPLNMLELAAFAYNNAAELGIGEDEKAEMLQRVIYGIDFLCRAQGSNGGFCGEEWIGGPERAAAWGNNLTGFGLRSAAQAVLEIYSSLDDEILNEVIDSDADGEADTDRKTAWISMMTAARDYLITLEGGYGHAPNQDMANSIAALRFDTAIVRLGGTGLKKTAAGAVLDRCFGLSDNLVTSCKWVSPKYTILENFGAIQGGYSGDYGSNAIVELSQLAEIGYDSYGYTYRRYLKNLYETIDNYYFTGKKLSDGVFIPQEYTEGVISNRNGYYPGTERYPIDFYSALTMNNDTALKIIANYLEQRDIASLSGSGKDLSPSNAHFEDNVLDAAYLYKSFDDIISAAESRDIDSYNFVMEDDSKAEYAWADEMARNVVIKDNGERIYMALNWRNPVHSLNFYNTEYITGEQRIKANNLCRVHATNGSYDRYGYAEMTTDGYSDWTYAKYTNGYMQALMTCRYGDYTVIMNSRSDKSFTAVDFEEAAGLNRAVTYKDLITGDVYSYSGGYWHSGGSVMTDALGSTLVLKELGLYASAPIIADGMAGTEVVNNTADTKKVTLYAAGYNEDGTLSNIYEKTVNAEPGRTYISLGAPEAQRAFVWNEKMVNLAR